MRQVSLPPEVVAVINAAFGSVMRTIAFWKWRIGWGQPMLVEFSNQPPPTPNAPLGVEFTVRNFSASPLNLLMLEAPMGVELTQIRPDPPEPYPRTGGILAVEVEPRGEKQHLSSAGKIIKQGDFATFKFRLTLADGPGISQVELHLFAIHANNPRTIIKTGLTVTTHRSTVPR